jgi:hypothetical protein
MNADGFFSRGLAYYDRAVDYAANGETDKAIRDYTEAIRLDPDFYFNRGIAYAEKGEHDKAEADFTKAKELGYRPDCEVGRPRTNASGVKESGTWDFFQDCSVAAGARPMSVWSGPPPAWQRTRMTRPSRISRKRFGLRPEANRGSFR